MYSIWADIILIIHTLFTSTVVFSVPLIIIGGLLHWQWVRNPWFRFIHLAMIGFVVAETLIGMACPLTVWENELRISMGESDYGTQDFIASWLRQWLFYSFPHWVFTLIYILFGLLVFSLFYFVPVHKKALVTPSTHLKP